MRRQAGNWMGADGMRERERERERGRRRQSKGKHLTDERCTSPVVFASILQGCSRCHAAPARDRDSRALVTCCVVKGKMTGIRSPPEPVKQQGDPLSECHSTVWKQHSPRRRQTMSVCDVIPREEADFSAGDSECRAPRPCVSVCLSACRPPQCWKEAWFNLFWG